MMRKFLVLLSFAGVAIALMLWLRPASTDYANFPPSATGPWIAFGDSLTEGVGSSGGHDYPSVLGGLLGIEILNQGRSGDTTAGGLARVDEITQLQPRTVLLCLGGNDALSQVPRDETLSNLAAIIDRLQSVGSFVVLIGIRSASLRDRNEEYFAQLAKEKRVAYLPDMLRGLAFKPVYMSDAIHPNDQGYALIVARLEKFLRPLLPQLKNVK